MTVFTATRSSLRSFLAATALLALLMVNACQCDSPPPIGPVDDEDNAHLLETPSALPAADAEALTA